MTVPTPHASDEPEITTIGPATFLSLTGQGRPGTEDFYAEKVALSESAARLGHPGPIEILYWYDPEHGDIDIAGFYWTAPLDALRYRMLVRVPDDTVLPGDLEPGDRLGLFTMTEGKVVQVMHHGPFADEDKTLARLGAFADAHGLRRSGPHHEIHLDAFGPQTPQAGLRTILRDPVS
jgi:effector-binding domain-containing protein